MNAEMMNSKIDENFISDFNFLIEAAKRVSGYKGSLNALSIDAYDRKCHMDNAIELARTLSKGVTVKREEYSNGRHYHRASFEVEGVEFFSLHTDEEIEQYGIM